MRTLRIAASVPCFNRFSCQRTAGDATETAKIRQFGQLQGKNMTRVWQFLFLNEQLKGTLNRNRLQNLLAAVRFI